ncbi:MAG: alanine racemase [Bacteroidetes bacterium HGW-Bacteroidetes-1]|jgi:alanine racemase|nr:MAG: alanine racemase [Bacteroidetes bacterium HGW-Bacteroidetes-1]
MRTSSTIELSFKAIEHNLRFLRKMLNNRVKISSVVKGNAYGHGVELYVPAAERCGIDHFSVFSVDEARMVASVKQPETTVMIMGWIPVDELSWVINNDIEFWIFETDRLEACLKIARSLNRKAFIHLELETGMNRTGLTRKEISEIIPILLENRDIVKLVGLCTHLAGAESIANYTRIHRQIKLFKNLIKLFHDNDLHPVLVHAASSAATIAYPAFRFDMVRVGILQFGYWPSKETFIHYISHRKDKIDPLKRIISWKTEIMALKYINQGEFISYGTAYFATEDKQIAIIPTGYAHGYSRSLSNSGRVLIHGHFADVIGMINMNMLIADVSSILDVKVGDEVVLIGNQLDMSISVASFSELSNQMNYELLARLPKGITRRLIQ